VRWCDRGGSTAEHPLQLIKQTAKVVQHWQQRIAAARKSHTKRSRKKLRKMGIKLKDLIRCKWP
jgi:hypothetical protein